MIANYKIAQHTIAHTIAPKSANSTEKFSFAGFGLDNEFITVTDFQGLHSAGASDFSDVGNIASDGGKFISRYWRKKTFTISGILKAKTPEKLEEIIDNFKKSFNKKEGIFRWKSVAGIYREIPATASAIDFDRKHYHITFVPFTLTMVANDVYWREKTNVQKTTISGTTMIDVNVGGNVPTEMQVIILITSGNMTGLSLSSKEKKLSIQTGGKTNILIDTKRKMVKMDNAISDYNGVHFPLEPGRNEILFGCDGIFSADIYVKYDTNFL